MKLTEEKLYKLIQEELDYDKQRKLIKLLSSSIENANAAIDIMDNAGLSVEDKMFVLDAALKNAKKYDLRKLINDKLDELTDEQDFGL